MKSIFTDKLIVPTDDDLKPALGETYKLWQQIAAYAHDKCPKANDEWKFPGEKHGWSFRVNDKKRVLVYLLPRDGFFKVAMVFGQKAFEAVMNSAVSEEKKSLPKELSAAFKGVGMLFGNIAFWVILFYFSAPSLPGWATKNWLPTLFSESLHMDMQHAGPLSTMTLALASLVGVLVGGYFSDKWVQKHLKGRIYTGVIGLAITLPALVLIGYGHGLAMIVTGAILFGLGFGVFDVNNMPILCQFVSSRYRATGYGLLNLAGISAGAVITNELGKALDAGHMNAVFVTMIVAVGIAIALQLTVLKPKTIDKVDA